MLLDPPVLKRLRDETRDLHAAVESASGLDRPVLKREDYVRVLKRMYPVVAGAEAWLTTTRLPAGIVARKKAGWITQDLAFFKESVPPPFRFSGENGDAWSWGVAYVLEGSTLGGQVISRKLTDDLGVTKEQGGRYFWGYGEATGENWRLFRETLTLKVTPAEADEAVEGARAVFGGFLLSLAGLAGALAAGEEGFREGRQGG